MKTNYTSIIFDEDFKNLLIKTRLEIPPSSLFRITTKNDNVLTCHTEIIDAQEQLRFFLKNNKDNINFNDEKKSLKKPDYFAFCVAFICDFEKFNSWDELSYDYNWTIEEYKYSDNVNTNIDISNIVGDCQLYCCCGKKIGITYLIKSTSTGYSLITGCCCILKHFINNKEITNTIKSYETKRKEEMKNYNKAIKSNIKFGKYSGMSYIDIYNKDKSYLNFLLGKDFFSNDKYPNNKYIRNLLNS